MMEKLAYAQSYRDLTVYQKARTFSKEVFEITKLFPKEEMYSLTDQLRRSSRSIGAQIAEAWGKRRYTKHFVSKLTDADSERLETQHWIDTAEDCGYLSHDQAQQFRTELAEIGSMINSMITKAASFYTQ